MESSFSRLYKLFSNRVVYLISLIVCGGLAFVLFKIDSNIHFTSISSFNDVLSIIKSNTLEFLLSLVVALLLISLVVFILPITIKKFAKIYIIIPMLLLIGNVIGYFLDYGLHVFLINITIFVLSIIFVGLSVLVSMAR